MMMVDLLNSFRVEGLEIIASLTTELLALEKSPADAQALATCLRLAHTLKGSARIVQQFAIGDMAHTLEDALLPLRHGEQAESEYFSDLLRIVGRMRESIEEISVEDSGTEATEAHSNVLKSPGTSEGESFETVRVEIAEMDQLLEGLSEATIQLSSLRTAQHALRQASQSIAALQETIGTTNGRSDSHSWNQARALVKTLTATLEQAEEALAPSLSRLEQELEGVRERANTLRLLPTSAILGALELSARDTARLLGKSVQFVVTGAEIKLEGHILLLIRDALLHVVRNAVDHGIESPSERESLGKPALGTISLDVVRRGRRVEFRCRDDGRGIDPEKVRATVISRGQLSAEKVAAMSTENLFSFLFETGVSTADRVTEISGRGVGLDIVRVVANRLRGHASIRSELGRGSTITIDVPVSLSAMTVLSVAIGEETVFLPFDAVLHTARLHANEIVNGANGSSILYDGQAIPFLPIHSLLGLSSETASRTLWTAIVLTAGSKTLAVGADTLMGTLDIMVKPLPPGIDASPVIAGAAFDGQGNPVLVLDPAGFQVERREFATKPRTTTAPPAERLPILVIDDSLTTRMLEQSILETAGYHVDLSASGEDGLRRAREKRYGLFIVDVEMPGMNGYEFTREIRMDSNLATIPIIMVTSLNAPEDRQRGLDAGATAYIVKRDFDQKYFVKKVSELMGKS